MTKDNETTQDVNNSNIQDPAIKEAYQKGFSAGLKQGRIEGILYYQKKIIENLNVDNKKMNIEYSKIKIENT